jgi:acetoacetate decarboxylase
MSEIPKKQSVCPGPPWQLFGNAVGIFRLVDRNTAQQFVQPGLKVVSVWPGKTIGGMLIARYDSGSTLEYNELIAFCGIVRRGLRFGGWISHIYVDDPASAAGGREIWGLPKELATFQFGDNKVVVRQGEATILKCEWTARGPRLPIPLWLPAWGEQVRCLLHFTAKGRARGRCGRVKFEVPAKSPLSTFLRSGIGPSLGLDRLKLRVPAPVEVKRS